MSYMPDASMIHTTSGGCAEPLGDSRRVIGSTLVNRFQGIVIEKETLGPTQRAVSIDVSKVTGLDPVYIANIGVTDKQSVEFEKRYEDNIVGDFSPDRRKIRFVCSIAGTSPFIGLKMVLANKTNVYRPTFEQVIKW